MTGFSSSSSGPGANATDPKVSRWRTKRSGDSRAKLLTLVLLCIGAVLIMVPFYWMISTALKDPGLV